MNPVRDEATEDRSMDTDRSATDESTFVTAARTVPEPVRRLVSAVHDDRSLGLLCEIDSHEGVPVRELLGGDLCESDLHGLCGELRAAGLLEECEVAGERGYCTTESAHEALSRLRGA